MRVRECFLRTREQETKQLQRKKVFGYIPKLNKEDKLGILYHSWIYPFLEAARDGVEQPRGSESEFHENKGVTIKGVKVCPLCLPHFFSSAHVVQVYV